MSAASISPYDAPNRRTIAQGHPTDWQPPRPRGVYELVVIGGGPAGLTAAITAARAGHTVALAERNLTGGTCVNFGCTPSKALLRAARAVHQARDGEKFGYTLAAAPRVDFAALMTRVREMRASRRRLHMRSEGTRCLAPVVAQVGGAFISRRHTSFGRTALLMSLEEWKTPSSSVPLAE
jgi:glycine/D-amino acid oxidase-like deaminating enzyme